MDLLKTEKDTLTEEEILEYIKEYEETTVPELTKLWRYYTADNPTIIDRKKVDANNPDNRTVVAYGRKLVTTFTGYGYRPRYITYKSDRIDIKSMEQLQETFDRNNEHLKTSRDGRNTAIFGLSYELLFVEGRETGKTNLPRTAEPRFVNVDPRELIVLYDMSIEPEIKIAIRFVRVTDKKYTVEVYYPDRVDLYTRERQLNQDKWDLIFEESKPNFFDEVPIVAYYLGDDMLGVIRPVTTMIDDLDYLMSGDMDEVSRFANAYLRLVGMTLSDPTQVKSANVFQRALERIKRSRVFENLRNKDDVSFLTKDIPAEFMKLMYDVIVEQIHKQSHVPDLTAMGDLSGIAVQRLMFDFENVVSSSEADFDLGLFRRVELINKIYMKTGRQPLDPMFITISHKRNVPLNLKEFADAALVLKNAGFSDWLVADVMPDDIIPDIEEELARQEEARNKMLLDIETMQNDDNKEGEDNGNLSNLPKQRGASF